MFKAFGFLASLKGLRGTAFDPFGYTAERRTERRLITHYEALMVEIARVRWRSRRNAARQGDWRPTRSALTFTA